MFLVGKNDGGDMSEFANYTSAALSHIMTNLGSSFADWYDKYLYTSSIR